MLISFANYLIPESNIRKIWERRLSVKPPHSTDWCVELVDGERLTAAVEPKTLSVIPNGTGVRLLIVRCYLEDGGQFVKTILERAIAAWHIEARNDEADRTDCVPIVPGERVGDEIWCYFDASTGQHWQDMGFYGLTREQAVAELIEGVEEELRRKEAERTAAAAKESA